MANCKEKGGRSMEYNYGLSGDENGDTKPNFLLLADWSDFSLQVLIVQMI